MNNNNNDTKALSPEYSYLNQWIGQQNEVNQRVLQTRDNHLRNKLL